MQNVDLSKFQLHELEELLMDVEEKIRDVKYKAWKEKRHTKEEIVAMFSRFGYDVPKGAKIWRVHPRGDKREGGYGMEVGSYDHSCHIDSSTYLVLLVVSGNEHYVESFSDMWLSEPITV
jgi:hypothetical protein